MFKILTICLIIAIASSHTLSENTKVRSDIFLENTKSGWKDEINAAGPTFVLLY